MTPKEQSVSTILYRVVALAVLNWRVFVKKLWLPFCLLLLIDLTGYFVSEIWLAWVVWICSFPIYVIFAVNTHRLYLLGPDGVSSQKVLRWRSRETRFLAYLIVLMAMGYLAAWGLQEISLILGTIGSILILYGFARLSLIFPAIAIDQEFSLQDSWDFSAQNQFLILAVIFGVPILFSGFSRLIEFIPFASVLNLFVGIILFIFTIGCLSMAFQRLALGDRGS